MFSAAAHRTGHGAIYACQGTGSRAGISARSGNLWFCQVASRVRIRPSGNGRLENEATGNSGFLALRF